MNKRHNPATFVAVILAAMCIAIGAASLLSLTGCTKHSETTRNITTNLGDALKSPLGRVATNLAINMAITHLTNSVKELRPYEDSLRQAFADTLYSPNETADRLDAVLARMPSDLSETVRYNLLLSLRSASDKQPPADVVGSPMADRYGNQLYTALVR